MTHPHTWRRQIYTRQLTRHLVCARVLQVKLIIAKGDTSMGTQVHPPPRENGDKLCCDYRIVGCFLVKIRRCLTALQFSLVESGITKIVDDLSEKLKMENSNLCRWMLSGCEIWALCKPPPPPSPRVTQTHPIERVVCTHAQHHIHQHACDLKYTLEAHRHTRTRTRAHTHTRARAHTHTQTNTRRLSHSLPRTRPLTLSLSLSLAVILFLICGQQAET